MEFLFFFSLTGVIIVSLILIFDKKQAVKVNAVLKEAKSVPPLFLRRATERKIIILKTALHYEDIPQNMAAAASMANIYHSQSEAGRITRVEELKLLSTKYNSGQISIETYNTKLDELLELVQSRGASFGMTA